MAAVTVARAPTTPSNLLRRKLCPASAAMEKGLHDKDSTDAQGGRFYHRYFTNPNYDRRLLKPEEQELLQRADMLLLDVLDVLGFGARYSLQAEQELTGVNGRLTGTPDQVFRWLMQNAALVNDLKSGFGIVERAELNLQLRGYAVLVAEKHPELESVYVSILQPRLWRPSERVTLAKYDKDDIKKAATEIDRIIDGTEQPNAPLVAGEELCRYCRAKLVCPAFRKAIALPLRKLSRVKNEAELSKLKLEEERTKIVKRCSDKQLEQLLHAVALADAIAQPVRAECRVRIRSGGFTNYVLGKEWEAREVKNVGRAIAALSLAGVATREQAIELCTMSLHALEDHLRATHKGMTWQQAKDRIERVLKTVLVREPREPRILPKKI